MFVPKAGQHGELVSLARRRPHLSLDEWAPLSLVLTHDAVAVLPGTSIESAASFMLRVGLDSLPVVDAAGSLLGVVSTRDLLGETTEQRAAIEQDAQLQPREREELNDELDDGFHGTCLSSGSISEVMIPSTLALSESTSISRAVAIMTRHARGELPVRCGRCGYCTVSALDLLSWLSRSRRGAK